MTVPQNDRHLTAEAEGVGSLAPWKATLYLEVRSKGRRIGLPNIEHRVYTYDMPVNPQAPDDATRFMVRGGTQGDSVWQTVITWYPEETDPVARTATFRQTLKASDKLLGQLEEEFGWVRQVQP